MHNCNSNSNSNSNSTNTNTHKVGFCEPSGAVPAGGEAAPDTLAAQQAFARTRGALPLAGDLSAQERSRAAGPILGLVVMLALATRENLSTGYGFRFSTEIYGSKRETNNGFPRIPTGILFCSHRNLRKSLETSGSLRENVT